MCNSLSVERESLMYYWKYLDSRILVTSLVSSPHLTSGWESSIALIKVVPLLANPPMNIKGDSLSYWYRVPSLDLTEILLLLWQ